MTRPDEAGFTIIEMMISLVVLSFVLLGFYTVWGGFMRDVGVQNQLDVAARDSRPVMRALVIEMRQSETASADLTDPVMRLLTWDHIQFASDREPVDGNPELYDYQLVNCAGGACELQKKITQPTANTSPNYTFTGTVTTETVLKNVIASSTTSNGVGPLFTGRTPPSTTPVASCSNAATACAFTIAVIDLRVDPALTLSSPRMFELHEEVRFRNAQA